MKINKISIKNFLSVTDLEVDTTKTISFFSGPNGSSKSSIFDAIYLALTSEQRRLKGRFSEKDLINENADSAIIKIQTDNNDFIKLIKQNEKVNFPPVLKNSNALLNSTIADKTGVARTNAFMSFAKSDHEKDVVIDVMEKANCPDDILDKIICVMPKDDFDFDGALT